MILTGRRIIEEQKNGRIIIEPFKEALVNPNSYDITLGTQLLVYTGAILDVKLDNPYEIIDIPPTGYLLQKNQFYLGHSLERIGSNHFVPLLHNKSGIARLGLFIHITADLIDIGSHGNITLQLYPTNSIKVYSGMQIGQVSFWCVQGAIQPYQGKYQDSSGPVASKSYLNFPGEEI